MKIYALSDNHGKLGVKVPPCDLLLVAGDVCPDYAPGTSLGSSMQEGWLNSKWVNWRNDQPALKVLATLGNHDFVWRRQAPTNFKVDELVIHTPDCDCGYVSTDETGHETWCASKYSLKIWFSPWSNTFGGWAWMKPPTDLKLDYDNIPEGTDIIVSHQPPYGYGDKVIERYRLLNDDPEGHVGSKELLDCIDRVKPKVVICGHIHSGQGTYTHTRPDGGVTTIYNVALVDDTYQLKYEPTEIVLT